MLIGELDNTVAPGQTLLQWLLSGYLFLKVLIGFSIIIFVHELGHFLTAKWMGIRVDRFAIGFFQRVCGYRRGEGFTFGRRPDYKPEELAAKGYGETDYCLNLLPFGGYVKMLGEDDVLINDATGEVKTTTDPRAFTNQPVGRRMLVVSAGVIFNLLFALVVYSLVFLGPGTRKVAPVIGRVEAGSPAANAGLLPGDRVLEINGSHVDSFDDILLASMLSRGPLRLRVQRGGAALDKELAVDLGSTEAGKYPTGGLVWTVTTTVSEGILSARDPQGLMPGDQVTHANGRPVSSLLEVVAAFEACGGRPVELTVQRPDPKQPQNRQTIKLVQRPVLAIGPAPAAEGEVSATPENRHLLGLLRRPVVQEVIRGGPAQAAGFQAGDVICQWGTVLNPLYRDISRSTESAPATPIPVVVEREGRTVQLTVTPKRPFSLLRSRPPRVGLAFGEEDMRPVVADVVPGTPAEELNLPRGAMILAVNGQPVETWFDVFEALKAAAGGVVSIRYRSGQEEAVGQMRVPASVVDALNLPPTARIHSIDGQDRITLPGGKTVMLPSPLAVRKLLEKNLGRTVTVEYSSSLLDPTIQVGSFAVSSDNLDPWQLRVVYQYDLEPYYTRLSTIVNAGGNPLRALAMGARQTGQDLWSVYRILRGLLSPRGRVGIRDVSGPVGIFGHAIRQAESGLSNLMFFLAYISANLAVINFIPLPVVDGGLMLFLLLEKIRGKPLGLKVQMITTIVGLSLIVLCFVLVTFQDIVKLWGGNL